MKIYYFSVLFLVSTLTSMRAEVQLAPVFGSHMVLQRNQAIPVWGKADAGETVTVEIAGQKQTAKADAAGKWMVHLAPIAAGENEVMKVSGSATKTPLSFEDVAVGEVWVCSGQSNMQFTLKDADNAATEIPLATNSQLRLSNGTSWAVCSPDAASGFSAIGYFFGKELNGRLHVPVGMINVSVGGTSIQQWTPEATLRALPALKDITATIDANAKLQKDDPKAFAQKGADLAEAQKKWHLDSVANDVGTKEEWFGASAQLDKWDAASLPMVDFEEGFSDLGTVWYRREVEIPAAWAGKPLVLNLPGIDDIDISYVNGKEVGRTWYDSVPDFWKVARHYSIPAELVSSDKINITIFVLNVYGIGGVFGKPEELSLSLKDDASAAPVSLAGQWLVRRGSSINMKTKPADGIDTTPGGNLYEQLIAPLQPYAIRGTIWYQGENNAEEPELYTQMFPAMIKSWRSAWGEGDFPFYFVSLAGYMGHQELAVEKFSWAEIREAQKSGLSLPHTGMAMAYDIGAANNIHPKNKIEVGRRLAALALARDYGMKIESQGPTFKGMKIEGDKVRVQFSHAGGMAPRGPELKSFAVAGSDKVFHFAKAGVEGSEVVLSAADGAVPKPVAVRYGWSSIPSGNLYNSAGFPAVPFRTDKWSAEEISSQGPGCR